MIAQEWSFKNVIYHCKTDNILTQMKILNMVMPITMYFLILTYQKHSIWHETSFVSYVITMLSNIVHSVGLLRIDHRIVCHKFLILSSYIMRYIAGALESVIFHVLIHSITFCGYSLELPRQGGSAVAWWLMPRIQRSGVRAPLGSTVLCP